MGPTTWARGLWALLGLLAAATIVASQRHDHSSPLSLRDGSLSTNPQANASDELALAMQGYGKIFGLAPSTRKGRRPELAFSGSFGPILATDFLLDTGGVELAALLLAHLPGHAADRRVAGAPKGERVGPAPDELDVLKKVQAESEAVAWIQDLLDKTAPGSEEGDRGSSKESGLVLSSIDTFQKLADGWLPTKPPEQPTDAPLEAGALFQQKLEMFQQTLQQNLAQGKDPSPFIQGIAQTFGPLVDAGNIQAATVQAEIGTYAMLPGDTRENYPVRPQMIQDSIATLGQGIQASSEAGRNPSLSMMMARATGPLLESNNPAAAKAELDLANGLLKNYGDWPVPFSARDYAREVANLARSFEKARSDGRDVSEVTGAMQAIQAMHRAGNYGAARVRAHFTQRILDTR